VTIKLSKKRQAELFAAYKEVISDQTWEILRTLQYETDCSDDELDWLNDNAEVSVTLVESD